MSKYVKIRGQWHSAKASGATVGNRHPALQIGCTGALAGVGFPESSKRPKDLCPACASGVSVLERVELLDDQRPAARAATGRPRG